MLLCAAFRNVSRMSNWSGLVMLSIHGPVVICHFNHTPIDTFHSGEVLEILHKRFPSPKKWKNAYSGDHRVDKVRFKNFNQNHNFHARPTKDAESFPVLALKDPSLRVYLLGFTPQFHCTDFALSNSLLRFD